MAGLLIGFTGNRGGMTDDQKRVFLNIFGTGNNYITEFHHGDCVGSDSDAHDIVRAGMFWQCKIIGHPPINDEFRAFKECDELMAPLPYLMRNQNIVKRTHHLIACPVGPEKVRSGTWSTIRYARKMLRPITILMPNGQVEREKG